MLLGYILHKLSEQPVVHHTTQIHYVNPDPYNNYTNINHQAQQQNIYNKHSQTTMKNGTVNQTTLTYVNHGVNQYGNNQPIPQQNLYQHNQYQHYNQYQQPPPNQYNQIYLQQQNQYQYNLNQQQPLPNGRPTSMYQTPNVPYQCLGQFQQTPYNPNPLPNDYQSPYNNYTQSGPNNSAEVNNPNENSLI